MKSKGEIVLICAILGFVVALVLMFPQARQFLFHGGGGEATPSSPVVAGAGSTWEETPRNPFPMGDYTQFFKKMRFAMDDESGGKRLEYYYWYAPPKASIPAGAKLPLVVVLHDKAGLDYGAIYLRQTSVQKEFPSFLLVPQAPATKVWASPKRYSGQETAQGTPPPPPVVGPESQELPDVIELVARLVAAYPIDDTRLYIIGCDEGANGVYGALADYKGIFAGGVAIGGIWSYVDGAKLAKSQLLILHGGQDTVVPPDFPHTMTQVIKTAGGHAYYGEFKTLGHECESPGYYSKSVWQWLFAQRRPAAAESAAAPAPAPEAPVAQ